ncbi:MAG: hypothetical protein WC119_00530 [Synergistaceae bacterium]
MKQIVVEVKFTYRWWREDGKDIVPEHIEALQETALKHIGEKIAEGYVEGELTDNIHMIGSDPEDGIYYRGYWTK